MNFWHMQLHPGGDQKNYPPSEILRIITQHCVIGTSKEWKNDRGQPNQFMNNMKIGDIVLIRRGGPLAIVQVSSDWYENNNPDLWFEIVRDIKVLATDGKKQKYLFLEKYEKNWNENLYCPATLMSAENSKFIRDWYMKIEQKKMLDVLKFKQQIILQGPPGTGKTYTAKQIAKTLTHAKKIGNAQEFLNNLLKNFDPTSEEAKSKENTIHELRSQFLDKYSIDKIENLDLDDYVVGRGNRNNFCWWLEHGLKPLGYYSPGSSGSFLMFWKKDINDYSKHGFLKDYHDNNDAFDVLKKELIKLIKKENLSESMTKFGDSFILKILNTYYPDEYFPINSINYIKNALKLLGKNINTKNPIELNQELSQAYKEKIKILNLKLTSNQFSQVLYENFNLKEGLDINEKNELKTQGKYYITQFHPSYTYEDFVRGIVAKTVEGTVVYQVENKLLAQIAIEAKENPRANYVLIIDEINRANLASVLGELIYALEYREEEVNSIYELGEGDEELGDATISLPKNLYIIGTMNTSDRSVGHIDYAIRRRFAFINLLPDISVISNENGRILFNKVAKLFDEGYLSPDFHKDDVQIGHSYFMSDKNQLNYKLEHEIKPILYEYLKDGVLMSAAKERIDELKV